MLLVPQFQESLKYRYNGLQIQKLCLVNLFLSYGCIISLDSYP